MFVLIIIFWVHKHQTLSSMKVQLFTTIAFLQIYFISAANLGIRLLLNKGVDLPTGETCTDAEWASITNVIDAATASTRRNLRRLPSYPAWCDEKCKGFTKGRCQGRHPDCDGYRRLEDSKVSSIANTAETVPLLQEKSKGISLPNIRDLFKSTTCEGQISELNTALNNLGPSLSSQCRSVLNAPREFTCLSIINNCAIQKIRLMNTDNDSVMVDNFKSGMSFCNSGPRITFEAINDSCVCNVQLTLKNSAGNVIQSRFEFYRPFVLYSNSAPNSQGAVDLYGTRLNIGSYSLEYYPDSDPTKVKTITFKVNNC
jgi:hypothetical protein